MSEKESHQAQLIRHSIQKYPDEHAFRQKRKPNIPKSSNRTCHTPKNAVSLIEVGVSTKISMFGWKIAYHMWNAEIKLSALNRTVPDRLVELQDAC